MPVYNGEKYIAEALDAILAQTYQDFEVIISDNASTDRTQQICQEYVQKDVRISYHRNEKNLGAAPNYNHVFHLAKGEYFKWAACDDQIAPDFLSKCVEVLDQNPDVVLCQSKTSLIDEKGKHLRNVDYKKVDANFNDPKKRFRNFLIYNLSGNFIFGLMRVSGMLKTALHGSYTSADLVFLAELALYGRFYVVPEYLFLRRDHSEQSTKGIWHSERARHAWFDTSLEDKIVLPKWLFLFGCLNAIQRAPLNVYDRTICYANVIRWIFFIRYAHNFLALCKDILVAAQKHILRFIMRLKQQPTEKSGKLV